MSNATLHSLPQRKKRKERESLQIADEENIENATGIERSDEPLSDLF